jgi:hypothetical protein
MLRYSIFFSTFYFNIFIWDNVVIVSKTKMITKMLFLNKITVNNLLMNHKQKQ